MTPLELAALEALRHFACMDEANAAMHTAEVRFSPITFRLAEALSSSLAAKGIDHAVVDRVMSDNGRYKEDPGR